MKGKVVRRKIVRIESMGMRAEGKIDFKSYAKIVNSGSTELSKELISIPTSTNDKGNEVVIFKEELVKERSKKWLGKPIMMDNTTAHMCHHGSGRAGYARILVEIEAKKALCVHCEVFGHSDKTCKIQMKNDEGNLHGKNQRAGDGGIKDGRNAMFTEVRRKQKSHTNNGGPSTKSMDKDSMKHKEKMNSERNQSEKNNKRPPSLEKVWRVNDDTMESLKKSANKGINNELKQKEDVNLVNEEFMKQHQKAHGIFLPYGISDHSPTVLLIQDGYCQKIKAFRLIKKLKNLKKPLRKLSWSQGNVHDRVNILKDELKKCQEAVDKNPFDKDSTFIHGRHIQDNILLAQELMRGYNKKNGPKRKFEFPNMMVKWIMACISSSTFSICLNGEVHGYFKGGRDLRQRDPISPYLFTLLIEVFNLIMCRNINASPDYGYHFGCKDLKSSHLCFADDLLVLCKGNKESMEVVKKSLEEFSEVSGLNPNLGKSIWDVAADKSDIWGWKTMLMTRDVVKEHVWYKVGNGKSTSVLYDKWCENGPLSDFICKRDIYDARIKDNVVIADMMDGDRWKWPVE
nr:hypothetical protein [Tanacetum cinerariifolium]